jgi:hypothetical protein
VQVANLPGQSAKDFRFTLWRIMAKSEMMDPRTDVMSDVLFTQTVGFLYQSEPNRIEQ